MKVIATTATLLLLAIAASADPKCKPSPAQVFVATDMLEMHSNCTQHVRNQIAKEMNAAMNYMKMAAHFARDVVNRPGFAKMFFESATEEREHATKLINYLLMRGELTQDISTLFKTYDDPMGPNSWTSGMAALEDALKLETSVTASIKNVIRVCEDATPAEVAKNENDYHLVDYLTGEFLDEQYKGQREIAGRISTLKKFMLDHKSLGEFLYDKKLLA